MELSEESIFAISETSFVGLLLVKRVTHRSLALLLFLALSLSLSFSLPRALIDLLPNGPLKLA